MSTLLWMGLCWRHGQDRRAFAESMTASSQQLPAIGTGEGSNPTVNFHGENLNELPLMVDAGMTPMQAIVATTRMGAELLQWADKIGTLAPGKLADIVVMDGNPLENIALFKDTKNIVHVMKDGAIIRSSLPTARRTSAPART